MPTQAGTTFPMPPFVPTYPVVNGVDILAGQQSVSASTGATTLVTIPAGRTWSGTVGSNCAASNAGANAVQGQARAMFTTAGAGVIPAANTYLVVEALAGANVAAGTVGDNQSTFGSCQWFVVAPAANSVTIQCTTTIAGTLSHCDSFAFGQLQ